MKSPTIPLPLLTRSHGPDAVLFHGSSIELLSAVDGHQTISPAAFREKKSRKSRRIYLLAAPFVRTFVHETIPLGKKDLMRADQQLQGTARESDQFRSITTIALNPERMITIHAHLTPSGVDLLKKIRKHGKRSFWKPAMVWLIRKLMDFAEAELMNEQTIRLYFKQEILQIKKTPRSLSVTHLYYLQPERPFSERCRAMDRILEDGDGTSSSQRFLFQPKATRTALPAGPFLVRTLQTKPLKRKEKQWRQSSSKPVLKLSKRIDRNHIAAAVLVGFGLWALTTHLQEQEAYRQRRAWQASIERLEDQSRQLEPIAERQERLFQLSSMIQAIEPLKIQPVAFLDILNRILPAGAWVYQAAITREQISIQLLDRGDAELTALIDSFSQELGKTSLEKSESVTLDDHALKKYKILIRPPHPDLLRVGETRIQTAGVAPTDL